MALNKVAHGEYSNQISERTQEIKQKQKELNNLINAFSIEKEVDKALFEYSIGYQYSKIKEGVKKGELVFFDDLADLVTWPDRERRVEEVMNLVKTRYKEAGWEIIQHSYSMMPKPSLQITLKK